jgi:pilus assembly protein CpaC
VQVVAVKAILIAIILVISGQQMARAQDVAAPGVATKDIEVQIGIDVIERVDFDYSTKVSIGNEQLLKLVLIPQKREIIFKGLKPSPQPISVTLRDNLGDVRMVYRVNITNTGKSNIVSELRELLGDIEGIEIGIRGGRVYVGGELVVPEDMVRIGTVLVNYQEVLRLIELSPQSQRVIARKMTDELARNNLRDVTVRVVNRAFWLEGVVSSGEKKKLAFEIASAYLPSRLPPPPGLQIPQRADIMDFIAVNEKKEPQPAPKMVKITSQFVELSKSYNRVFAFKWAPLMGEDQSSISIGQTQAGNITSTARPGTLSATISGLFPKLNSARTAGYARVIQSGMVIMRDQQKGQINKRTVIPFNLGSGDFTRGTQAEVGLTMDVTPRILEQENVEMQLSLTISTQVGSSQPPITTNNSVNTNVVVRSRESAAIGGVVQNQSTTDYDNEPNPMQGQGGGQGGGGAAASPPLFRLYRSKNYMTNKSQYVIFITPEIVENAASGTEEIRRKFRRRE